MRLGDIIFFAIDYHIFLVIIAVFVLIYGCIFYIQHKVIRIGDNDYVLVCRSRPSTCQLLSVSDKTAVGCLKRSIINDLLI